MHKISDQEYGKARSNSHGSTTMERFDIEDLQNSSMGSFFSFIMNPNNLMTTVMAVEAIKVSFLLISGYYTELEFMENTMHTSRFAAGETDYNEIFGRGESAVGFPAIAMYYNLYEYGFVTYGGKFSAPAQAIGAIVHLAITWTVVKIYQNAYEDDYKRARIVLLFCLMSFPLTITVAGVSLDSKALLFSLLSILSFQNHKHLLGVVLFSISWGIRMEAFYFLPAVCYFMAMSNGQFLACWGLLLILILQYVFAYPFVHQNALSYFTHAYVNNFKRAFDTGESMTWAFLPNFVVQSIVFRVILTLLHGSILKFMLFFRFLDRKTMFKDLNICPLKFFPNFVEQRKQYITEVFFLIFLAGVMVFKGAFPQTMIWWIYSIPFLLDFVGHNFETRGAKIMAGAILGVDFLYMLYPWRLCRIATHGFLIYIFAECIYMIIKQRKERLYLTNDEKDSNTI